MTQTADIPKAGSDVDVRNTTHRLTWTLALLTIPGAVLVVFFALAQVMASAGCTDEPCRHQGPGEFWFGILCYGAPIVAVVTLVVTFFAAKRRFGVVAPLIGLTLLIIDAAVVSITFGR